MTCDKAVRTLEIFSVDRGAVGSPDHKVSLKGRPRRIDEKRHQEDQGHHGHGQQDHEERVDVESKVLQDQLAPLATSAASENPHSLKIKDLELAKYFRFVAIFRHRAAYQFPDLFSGCSRSCSGRFAIFALFTWQRN